MTIDIDNDPKEIVASWWGMLTLARDAGNWNLVLDVEREMRTFLESEYDS